MASVIMPMGECKPPPYMPLYASQVIPVSPAQSIQYKCLYLAILILELILSLVGAGILIFALFIASVNDDPNRDPHHPVPLLYHRDPHHPVSLLYQVLIVFGIFFLFFTQYFGWRGYKEHHIRSIYIYAFGQGLYALTSFFLLLAWFTVGSLFIFTLGASFTVVPILFANQLKKVTVQPDEQSL